MVATGCSVAKKFLVDGDISLWLVRLFRTCGSTDGGRAWLGFVAGTKEGLLDMMACAVVT